MPIAFHSDPLLLELYGCCAEPSRWSGLLDRICAAVGARSAVIQGITYEQGERGQPFWCVHDSRTNQAGYERLISDARNPRLEGPRFATGIGRLTSDDMLFPRRDDQPLKQRLQHELSELGLGRFLGGLMPIGQGRFVGLALHRDLADEADFSPADHARLTGLLPHLAQAVSLSQAAVAARSLEAALRGCLDRWHGGLLVCDREGRVQWMNRFAQRCVGAATPLRLQDGRLQARGAQGVRLQAALLAAEVSGERGFLALEHAGERLHLALLPLAGGGANGVLVSVSDGRLIGDIPASALSVLFNLTDAEARLTGALVRGDTLEQYAQRRGVSVGTVRYQLKQVLVKTGAGRQSDLVRTVLCSAAAQAAGFGLEGLEGHDSAALVH